LKRDGEFSSSLFLSPLRGEENLSSIRFTLTTPSGHEAKVEYHMLMSLKNLSLLRKFSSKGANSITEYPQK